MAQYILNFPEYAIFLRCDQKSEVFNLLYFLKDNTFCHVDCGFVNV